MNDIFTFLNAILKFVNRNRNAQNHQKYHTIEGFHSKVCLRLSENEAYEKQMISAKMAAMYKAKEN